MDVLIVQESGGKQKETSEQGEWKEGSNVDWELNSSSAGSPLVAYLAACSAHRCSRAGMTEASAVPCK